MNTRMALNRSVLYAALIGLASYVQGAHAQTSYPVARGTIPFAFQLGTRTLPPGVYTVRMISTDIMELEGTKVTSLGIVRRSDGDKQPKEAKLVFLHQGAEYRLQQVWAPNRDLHLECAQPKQKRVRQPELAVITPNAPLIEVALGEAPR